MSTVLSSGRPDAEQLRAALELVDQPVVHALLHEQPRAGAAHLALVEPDRVDHALDHAVEVRVLEDDERALPAQLERQLLPRAGRLAADDAPTSVEPGERDLVDAVVRDERRARAPVAGHDVEHARRQPGVVRELGEAHRRERRELAGLSTTAFPAASAGATFHASISSGKFHGMICPTTPSGP
jgi:hypothetical protein